MGNIKQDFPSEIIQVPHLGNLLIHARDGHTLLLACGSRFIQNSDGTKPTGVDDEVFINKVPYAFCVTAHTKTYFDQQDTSTRYGSTIWTTDGSWGIRAWDITAHRTDAENRGKALSDSAQQKLTKRCVLFLDGWVPTEDAQRLIAAAEDAARREKVEMCRSEIRRLRAMVRTQEQRLAELLRLNVSDLLALRQAFEENDDLYPITNLEN